MLRRLSGEAISGPNPPIQRRPLNTGQLEWSEPCPVEKSQAGQRVSVDPVGLGVARHEPAQICCLGRGDPVDLVAAVREEHRDLQPRRPGRFHHYLQPRAVIAARQRRCLHLIQALHGRPRLALRNHLAVLVEHPHGVRGRDAQVDPDQAPLSHVILQNGRFRSLNRLAPRATHRSGHGPKEDTPVRGSHSCAATGSDLDGPSHFPHPGHSWPGRVWQSVARGQPLTELPQRPSQRHAPDQPGRPCNPGTPERSTAGVPYMRRRLVAVDCGTCTSP